jgi:hypothetical protein
LNFDAQPVKVLPFTIIFHSVHFHSADDEDDGMIPATTALRQWWRWMIFRAVVTARALIFRAAVTVRAPSIVPVLLRFVFVLVVCSFTFPIIPLTHHLMR